MLAVSSGILTLVLPLEDAAGADELVFEDEEEGRLLWAPDPPYKGSEEEDEEGPLALALRFTVAKGFDDGAGAAPPPGFRFTPPKGLDDCPLLDDGCKLTPPNTCRRVDYGVRRSVGVESQDAISALSSLLLTSPTHAGRRLLHLPRAYANNPPLSEAGTEVSKEGGERHVCAGKGPLLSHLLERLLARPREALPGVLLRWRPTLSLSSILVLKVLAPLLAVSVGAFVAHCSTEGRAV